MARPPRLIQPSLAPRIVLEKTFRYQSDPCSDSMHWESTSRQRHVGVYNPTSQIWTVFRERTPSEMLTMGDRWQELFICSSFTDALLLTDCVRL